MGGVLERRPKGGSHGETALPAHPIHFVRETERLILIQKRERQSHGYVEDASAVVTVGPIKSSDQYSSTCVAIHGTRTINQRVPRLEGALVDFSSGDFVVVTMYASCA